ncbi:hypothetical protein, partial [Nitratireductor sp. XY-223]|uniref:hypothetical protein n=1 Tax=Nitratireductor sp. XY-223 TaxID=2561926 RepID=UPI001980DB5E
LLTDFDYRPYKLHTNEGGCPLAADLFALVVLLILRFVRLIWGLPGSFRFGHEMSVLASCSLTIE